MTIQTKTFKCSYRGWQSVSSIKLDENHEIRVLTMKRSSGAIATTAQRVTIEGDMISYVVYSDFGKCYKTTNNRCTEKNVVEQHNAVVADVNQIKADCEAWYIRESAQ